MLWQLSLLGQVQGWPPRALWRRPERVHSCDVQRIPRMWPHCFHTGSRPLRSCYHVIKTTQQAFSPWLDTVLPFDSWGSWGSGLSQLITHTQAVAGLGFELWLLRSHRGGSHPLAECTRYFQSYPISLLTCVNHSHKKLLLLPDPLHPLWPLLVLAHASARISPSQFSTHSLTSWVIVTGDYFKLFVHQVLNSFQATLP